MPSIGAVSIAHRIIAEHVKPGDICIDATAGRGNDALYLCNLAGKKGKVIAIDVQDEAVESTRHLLAKNGFSENAEVILDSHINMDKYVLEDSVSCIIFNFGWLPGGDHNIATKPSSSIIAIEKGLNLLKSGGLMSLCIYHGKESGFAEKAAILSYIKTIDSKLYTVIVSEFVNRPNNPPIFVAILKG